jgi:type IV secretory pathway VirJ component
MRRAVLASVSLLSLAAAGVSAQIDSARTITEIAAAAPAARVFAIFMTGDGGWRDLDKAVGAELARAGVSVVGIDSRAYLTTGRRDPAILAADIAGLARHYQTKWATRPFALIGYSRGAVLLPFAAARLPADLKADLRLIALLGLEERAGFTFHLTDLVSKHSPRDGPPVLPELERLRGTPMLCVYGREEVESLCRSVDSTLVRRYAREGGHHFDRDYPAVARIILDRLR